MPPAAAAAAPAQTAASKACHQISLGGDIWVMLFQVISSSDLQCSFFERESFLLYHSTF